MKAADLRKSILQAAVQGKLVPQDKNDEPASELLKQIQAKKAVLIKEGKLKKEKPLPPITEEEIPNDLPDGWVWCRLCDLGSFSSGKTPDMTNPLFWDNGTVLWVSSKDMKLKYLNDSKMKITELAKENMTVYPVGTLLMVVRSGILKRMLPVCILTVESTINQDIKAYSLFDLDMSEYVYFMLKGLEKTILDDYTKQVTTVDSLRFDEFSRAMPVPLPPADEQRRIVSKVSELMAMCDELEAAEKKLDALEGHFFDYLPKSILQAAVQGKLAPQDKNDEPASELLKRIQAEKAVLIKEGKLKKGKPLPPITEDEIPYDLPEGWAWCRIGYIHQIIRGITFPSSVKHDQIGAGLVRCATTGSVQQEYNEAADTFVPIEYVKREDQWLKKNDIIMSTANSRELVGKTCIWRENKKRTFGGFLTTLRPLGEIIAAYSYYAFKYMQAAGAFNTSSTQTTNIANINNEILKNTLYPLPPIAEQKRIVAKVDELMRLCDELKMSHNIPIDHTNIRKVVQFPKKVEDACGLALVARGNVEGLSSEALEIVHEMFAEDDE